MLLHLSIDNFTIASHLEMELAAGMTAITGETGAGKSIMIDALGLALGDRADAGMVRHGSERSDIHATFDIRHIPLAQAWLQERELITGNECLLRRSISSEGRSRAYINGFPCTLQDLKALGNLLVDIHGQHEHQTLLKPTQQRRLLDEYAGNRALLDDIAQLAQRYQQQQQQLERLENNRNEQTARAQLLGYQIAELDELALGEDELTQLEAEQKQLSHGEQILQSSQHALALCKEGEINVLNILQQALRSLHKLPATTAQLTDAGQLLNSALIQTEEASRELEHYINSFELDPQRLDQVQRRLDSIYDIARKHHIRAEEIPALHQQLQQELLGISGDDETLQQLHQQQQQLLQRYRELAGKLSQKRHKAAAQLQKQVEQQLGELAMASCRFSIELQAREHALPQSSGLEDVSFLVSTNPGQPLQALAKVASGGELSRISLAIQVVTAKSCAIPTLVLDEVDVGIGGAVAEVVGRLLQQLGRTGQVICVTHQAQVASRADHHITVKKLERKKQVETQLLQLSEEHKIDEIARMLGGIHITDQSRAHARELLGATH